jgi:hypothetical protein
VSRGEAEMQLDDTCVRYNASVSSCINVLYRFSSTEFQCLVVLNIFKVVPANLSPG